MLNAHFTTSEGNFTVRLFDQDVPNTVANFVGLAKGDTMAIMLNNRPEFIPTDLGAVALGAVPFSIYQTSAPEQIEYLLTDAKSKVAITEKAFTKLVNERDDFLFEQMLSDLDRAIRFEDSLIYTEPHDWHAPVLTMLSHSPWLLIFSSGNSRAGSMRISFTA